MQDIEAGLARTVVVSTSGFERVMPLLGEGGDVRRRAGAAGWIVCPWLGEGDQGWGPGAVTPSS
ncbi:hypothetical protein SNE510_58690 [Streptomyces sp. NE5-10]|nr:hypothetical protein SNE510_58690 [Streptomyces sp. NE5-10]